MEKYISELLYKHECVVIPGFGAFITNMEPSKFIKQNSQLKPPSKQIAFNSVLTTNDGTFAHYISTKEKLSFSQSLSEIKNLVDDWNKKLASKQTVSIENIGSLVLNEDNKIIFTPIEDTNYETDSYGFDILDIAKINRNEIKLDVEEVALEIEKQKEIGRHKIPSVNKNKRIILYSLGAYLPILIALWVFLIVKDPIPTQDLAGINPFDYQKDTVESIEIANPEKPKEIDNQTEKVEPLIKAEEIISGPGEPIVEETVQAEVDYIIRENMGLYFVIGGSFKTLDRAEILYKEFVSKNFNSNIIFSTNGKIRVSYSSYYNYKEAVSALKEITSSENSSAWILKQ